MAKRKRSSRGSQPRGKRDPAKAAIRDAIAQMRADLGRRQSDARKRLKAAQKAEREELARRIRDFRTAGAALKRAGAVGFDKIDWRRATPSKTFLKSGKRRTAIEKAIGELHGTASGDSKLVKVTKEQAEKLRKAGYTVRKGQVQILKEEQVTPSGEVMFKASNRGGTVIPVVPYDEDRIEVDIRRYFDRHPGQNTAAQLGRDGNVFWITTDDSDTLREQLQNQVYLGEPDKQFYNEIILFPAQNIDTVRARVAKLYRARMKLLGSKPRKQYKATEMQRAKRAAKMRRYRARLKSRKS